MPNRFAHTLMTLFFVLGSSVLYAKDSNINESMEQASAALSKLIPYAYDDSAFRASKNKAQITQLLAELDTLFERKSQALGKKSDTALITLNVLQKHLSETSQLYSAGHYAMSQYLLTSTPALCATCHIQDSAHSSIQSTLSSKDFANNYSYAEYLFTIRNYDQAQNHYKRYLKKQDVQQSRFRYMKPLERLLTIELGIRRSIDNSKALLEKYQSEVELIEIKQLIDQWVKGIEGIKISDSSDHKQLKTLFDTWFSAAPNQGHEFILDESLRPKAIWLRANLYDSLSKKSDNETIASTLYMLSVIDRLLGSDEPYSFANLYLKQCVTKYPETTSAQACLDEYKNHLSFYYGGSAGESVPEELVKEYQAMKAILEKAKN